MASDMYVHFTPEFFGQGFFTQTPSEGNKVLIEPHYFSDERTVLQHALMLCNLHVRIMLVFDACFDGTVLQDAGWRLLSVTFEQLAAELQRELPGQAEAG